MILLQSPRGLESRDLKHGFAHGQELFARAVAKPSQAATGGPLGMPAALMFSRRREQAMQDQFALSNFQRAGLAGDVATQGSLGAFRQGLTQQQLQADADAARTAAYEPQQRLQQYGGGLGQLAGFASPAPAFTGSSPFGTALSTATGIAGLFGKLYG